MAEHPIIYSTEMVRAVLDGRKTKTRRIIKPQPEFRQNKIVGKDVWCWDIYVWGATGLSPNILSIVDKCPYGKVGDTLWVRESMLLQTEKGSPYFDVLYCADKSHLDNKHELDDWFMSYSNWYGSGKDKQIIPSIHMKKEATRIFLEITNIRVERVQDISEEDTKAEGVIIRNIGETWWRAFHNLWDSINAKRGYGWDKNPWVWVIEFKRTERK